MELLIKLDTLVTGVMCCIKNDNLIIFCMS